MMSRFLKFQVNYAGKHVMDLNPSLARQQERSDYDLNEIKKIHRKRLNIFKDIEKTNDISELRVLAKRVDDIDFELQDYWGFKRDKDYHTWWFQMPKCSCSIDENWGLVGSSERSIDDLCVFHGTQLNKLATVKDKIEVFESSIHNLEL